MKPRKAPGEDLITNGILREVFRITPEVLLFVYNKCLRVGCFPSIWKRAVVKFLLKSEDRDRSDTKLYRPICLLSVVGKLLERLKVIKREIWRGPDLFNKNQYGFVKRRSTTDAVLQVVRFVKNAGGKYVAAILFDVEGAFDSLWWQALLMRLRKLECPMNLYNLLVDYLNESIVAVCSSGNRYEACSTRGCPQGSVLGPVLWNFTYDILLEALNVGHERKVVAYADDLIVLESGNSRK